MANSKQDIVALNIQAKTLFEIKDIEREILPDD